MSNENVVVPETLTSFESVVVPETTKEISYPITIKSTIRTETCSYSDMLKKGLKIETSTEELKIEPKEETKEKPKTLPNKNRRFTRN